jgi:hypothetical protein
MICFIFVRFIFLFIVSMYIRYGVWGIYQGNYCKNLGQFGIQLSMSNVLIEMSKLFISWFEKYDGDYNIRLDTLYIASHHLSICQFVTEMDQIFDKTSAFGSESWQLPWRDGSFISALSNCWRPLAVAVSASIFVPIASKSGLGTNVAGS